MARETHTVTFRGPVSDASLLVQMLAVRGVEVDWEGTPEQGRAHKLVTADVVDLACTGAGEAIEAAVTVFQARFSGAAVEIDGPGQIQAD